MIIKTKFDKGDIVSYKYLQTIMEACPTCGASHRKGHKEIVIIGVVKDYDITYCCEDTLSIEYLIADSREINNWVTEDELTLVNKLVGAK